MVWVCTELRSAEDVSQVEMCTNGTGRGLRDHSHGRDLAEATLVFFGVDRAAPRVGPSLQCAVLYS